MDPTDHVNLLKAAHLARGGRWADLGAGSGAFTLALRELVGPQADIYAVDKDRAGLRELEQAHQARFGDASHLHIFPADFTRAIELPPLDGALMANSLHFFKNGPTAKSPRSQDSKKSSGRSLAVPEENLANSASSRSTPVGWRLKKVEDKLSVLRHVRSFLKAGGALLLVEYNVDSGNPWVPYPLSFETFRALAPRAGFSEPRLLATAPSRFLRGFYSAVAQKQEH